MEIDAKAIADRVKEQAEKGASGKFQHPYEPTLDMLFGELRERDAIIEQQAAEIRMLNRRLAEVVDDGK